MTALDGEERRKALATLGEATRSAAALRLAPALFAAALFMSALLLFAVQPMFTKMVLPKLGGSPSVWSVAMVAFQGFLFIGYVYAHMLSRALAPGRAAMVHMLVLLAVAAWLPLGIAHGFDVPPVDGVMPWLIALFAISIGLPFVALSATAPLLQNWFVATGHPQAGNPYVLYAASNLGSFCALLAYPVAIEPFLTLGEQSLAWNIGFALLALGICIAACMVARTAAHVAPVAAAPPPLSRRMAEWGSWTLLMAVPAGLCIAVTAFITTDLAAAPFLWVLPLALYLLTFVAIFRERPWIPHEWVLRLVPYAVAPLAVSMLGGHKVHWLAIIMLNLAAFVLIALACHGQAYRQRPETARLTEFYLWTSFGGVIGGVFTGLVAPNVFNNVYEYPILIVIAVAVLPGVFAGGLPRVARELAPPIVATLALILLYFIVELRPPAELEPAMAVFLVGIAATMLLYARRPARFLGLLVMTFIVTGLWHAGMRPVHVVRSFFGVHQVVETVDGAHRLLFHGTTIHGAERIRDLDGRPISDRPDPLTYYYFGGPLAEAVEATRGARGRLNGVAVVGLGSGSMACHRRADERWTFFEIDPEVIRLASDDRNFRFLKACGPLEAIVPGDARLTLAASRGRYDLIVLDAFSSDAIPVHLLTREAFANYLARLEPNGAIAVHVSNRYMELMTVVAVVGAAEGLIAYGKVDDQANRFTKDYRANAEVVVLAKSSLDLGDLPRRKGWKKIGPRAGVAPWTDDYSDVLRAILRKKFDW